MLSLFRSKKPFRRTPKSRRLSVESLEARQMLDVPSGLIIANFAATQSITHLWTLSGSVSDTPYSAVGLTVTFGGPFASHTATVGADGHFSSSIQTTSVSDGDIASAQTSDTHNRTSNLAQYTVSICTVTAGNTLTLNGGTQTYNGVVIAAGATLAITDNTTIIGGVIDNSGTITVSTGKALTVSNGLVNNNGGAISGNIVDNAVMQFLGDTTSTTVSGVISGTGRIEKSGSATLTLSGANTFTGGVTLNAGTLNVGNDSALGSSTSDPGVTVNGGTLNLNGHVVTINDLALLGGKIDLTTGGLIVPQANFSFVPSGGQDNEYLTNGTGNAEYGNAAIHDALQEGANFASGYWDGTHGILSSAAAADLNYYTAVGDAWNDYLGYTSWRGKTVGSDSLLVSYTYYGDADMNGTVTTTDYSIWSGSASMGYGTATGSIHTEWIDGDWDGNGICDSEDFGLWTESHNLTNLGFNAS